MTFHGRGTGVKYKKIISDIAKETLTAKQLNLLDAVDLLNKAWQSVSISNIVNCLRKELKCHHVPTNDDILIKFMDERGPEEDNIEDEKERMRSRY